MLSKWLKINFEFKRFFPFLSKTDIIHVIPFNLQCVTASIWFFLSIVNLCVFFGQQIVNYSLLICHILSTNRCFFNERQKDNDNTYKCTFKDTSPGLTLCMCVWNSYFYKAASGCKGQRELTKVSSFSDCGTARWGVFYLFVYV